MFLSCVSLKKPSHCNSKLILKPQIFLHFQTKRSKLHEQLLKSELTWKKIIKFVDDNLDKKEHQTVNGDLKTILQAAKQIGMFSFSGSLVRHCCVGWGLFVFIFFLSFFLPACLHTGTILVLP